MIFIKDGIIFPVPKHPGHDISPGVEKKIISLVGLTPEEFKNLQKVSTPSLTGGSFLFVFLFYPSS